MSSSCTLTPVFRTEVLQRAGNREINVPAGVFRKAAGEANKEMLEKVASNNLPVNALPSYNKIKQDVPGVYRNPDPEFSLNFLGNDTDVDVHHLVEWRFFRRLKPEWSGWTKEQCNDIMPGVMLEMKKHRELYGALRALNNVGVGELMPEMRQIYIDHGLHDAWRVVKKWCDANSLSCPGL